MKLIMAALIIPLLFYPVQVHGPPDIKAREIVDTAVEKAKENDKIKIANLQFKKHVIEYDLNDDQSIKKLHRDDVFRIHSIEGEPMETLIERMGKAVGDADSEKARSFGSVDYEEILQEALPNNFNFYLTDEERVFEQFAPTHVLEFRPKPNIKRDSLVAKLAGEMEGRLYIDEKSNTWRVELRISRRINFYFIFGAVYEAEAIIQQRRYGDIVVMDYIDARARFRRFFSTTHRRYKWRYYDYEENKDPTE
jgi:hypothetical protein